MKPKKWIFLAVVLVLSTKLRAETANAIYNGDFVDGVAGWAVLGSESEHVRLEADLYENQPAMSAQLLEGVGFRLYSQYSVPIQNTNEYEITAKLEGEGMSVALGVINYDENDNHTGYSFAEPVMLSEGEVMDLVHLFQPEEGTRYIRLCLQFTEWPSADSLLRILSAGFVRDEDTILEVQAAWPQARHFERAKP